MSEETENTQPNTPSFNPEDTQPTKPVKKPSRWKSTLLGILGFLILIGLGGFGGYSSGIGVRKSTERAGLVQTVSEQYSLALVDIQFGRYEVARQRLEYVISKDPGFPGAQEKLTEVLVLSSAPTPTPTLAPTSTPDFSGAENAFAQAQQFVRVLDWPSALGALDSIRKLDPTYKTAQVDGMYYFVLRNYGYDLITQQGNLEGGIYYLTLAERFGPLDNSANGLREGARAYLTGASFWELDWEQAVNYFSQVAAGWPSLWDGTMTAGQRYYTALVNFGNELFTSQDYCAAYDILQDAASIGQLDGTSASNLAQAQAQCFPATEAVAPATTAPATTEAPTEAPTQPPTEAPTDAPTEVPTP
ncbi:MAG TPA: hypothetical protein PKL78_05140 [Anaerolineales bacterium]|nr:hypothetical protein [Anaerolineales bacterium]HNN12920.1 hypothetical protein [Anaerolineales bacterium]HNO30893.1 hypothetical protein [Anaerolineales bacterium]